MTALQQRTPPPPARSRRRTRDGRWTPYLLLSGPLILIMIFLVYPIGNLVYYSLQNYNLVDPSNNGFAGIDNFKTMFHDSLFWQSLEFTAKWVVVQVFLQLVFGLLIALIVNETFVGRALARALVFAPWAVSGVLTTTIWLLIYNPTLGVGHYLAGMGIGSYGSSMLAQGNTAFWAAIIAELWRGVPFFAILILADLQTASPDTYEAGKMDGASRMQRFRFITLPHLRNAILLATLLRAVWEFNNVDLLYTLTGGGPANSTMTLPLYIATQAVKATDFGYGAALTMASFVILAIFAATYLWLGNLGNRGAKK